MQVARRRPIRRNPREVPAPVRAARLRPQTSGLRPDTLMQTCVPFDFTLADGAGHTFFERDPVPVQEPP